MKYMKYKNIVKYQKRNNLYSSSICSARIPVKCLLSCFSESALQAENVWGIHNEPQNFNSFLSHFPALHQWAPLAGHWLYQPVLQII